MARPQSRFVCQSCGEAFLRWEGQCRACGGWNTPRRDRRARAHARRNGRRPRRRRRPPAPAPLAGIADADLPRLRLGIAELDRVLGGGLVPGSLVLVGGEPGIGKSTLLLQAAAGLARADGGGTRALRDRRGVAGPGPAARGAARAARAGRRGSGSGSSPSTTSGGSSRSPGPSDPALVVVDSIQTATVDELDGRGRERRPGPRVDAAPDGPGEGRRDRGHPRRPRDQGRLDRRPEDARAPRRRGREPRGRALRRAAPACARRRTASARPTRSASSRWPRPACSRSPTRRARSSPITAAPRPGSVVAPTLEGSRPLLVEVQALVSPTGYGTPSRKASGARPEPAQPADRGPRPAGRHRPRQPRRLRQPGRRPVGRRAGARPAARPRPRLVAARPADPAGTVAIGEVGLLGELRPVVGPRAAPARGGPARVRAGDRAASVAAAPPLAADRRPRGRPGRDPARRDRGRAGRPPAGSWRGSPARC